MKPLIGCLLVFFTLSVQAKDFAAPLNSLLAELQAAREHPWAEDQPRAKCPENLDQLVGVSQSLVLSVLGSADFSQGNAYSYFFVGSLPAGLHGGGFPELTFTFNAAGEATEVSCHYSR